MIDSWMKVAYAAELQKQEASELENLLRELPLDDLKKLASGVPLEGLPKVACGGPDSTPGGFLDPFKGTPLLDQAIALEQEELQLDVLEQQKRQERRAAEQSDNSVWDAKGQIRMKKRLLELELVKQQNGAVAPAAPPPAPGDQTQGAGAMGPVPNEQPMVADKVASTQAEKIAFADALGRSLARQDFEKAASAATLTSAGASLAKMALDMGAVTGAISKAAPMAQKALGVAMKHPGATGAAIGAAGGAIAGGKDHRLSGALGGASLGAAAGGVGANMAAGKAFGPAVASSARTGINSAMRGANSVASRMPGQLGARISGAAGAANQAGHDMISRFGG